MENSENILLLRIKRLVDDLRMRADDSSIEAGVYREAVLETISDAVGAYLPGFTLGETFDETRIILGNDSVFYPRDKYENIPEDEKVVIPTDVPAWRATFWYPPWKM